MDKFGRRYTLRVGTQTGTLTIELPFTLELDITRNTLTSANVCQIRVFNLSKRNRDLIRFNTYEYATFKSIELYAGYNANPPLVFSGNISQAWSFREGVNFITQIECFDGGFAFVNGVTDTAFPSGTPQKTVIKTVMKDLPHTTPGVVGDYPGTLTRGNTYSGNTAGILTQLTGGGFFVDNGKANALNSAEYIAAVNGTTLVNAQTGLLGTPVLENNLVRFDMLFEPGLNVGHRIQLISGTENNFNGFYKITAVKHRGMISESVCGSLITTGEFVKFPDQQATS